MCFHRIFIKKPGARGLVRPALIISPLCCIYRDFFEKNRTVNRKGN
jgi:hypothetical protein